jgi:hypothetical protein
VNFIKSTGPFSRRNLLKAAGCSLFVPAFLKNSFAQDTGRPPNLVLLMQTNGTVQESFWPEEGAFNSLILSELLSKPELAARTTLVKGIDYFTTNDPTGNEHDKGFHGLYSGYACVAGTDGHFAGGVSVDHVIADNVELDRPIKKIHCGVHAVDYKAINAGRISFSALGLNQHAPCELDVYTLFERVFGPSGTTPDAEQAQLRLTQRQSVLDAVSGDLLTLQQRLGPVERNKVDVHLTALRDFEARLTNHALNDLAACREVAPSLLNVPTAGQGNEANAPALLHLFMEFIANAIACDMVGVLSFQFGRGGEHFHYKWLEIEGMPSDAHDFVAHADTGDPEIRRINTDIKLWYTTLITELAAKLQSIPRSEGVTALDESLVVWGNEIATGPHGLNSIPVALLGGAAGRLARTGYVVDAGSQPHHRLGATLCNIMGMSVSGFGQVPDCGVLQGLELNVPG